MVKKCLIVDDVDVSRYVISEIMKEFGFSIVEASDEKSAIGSLDKEKFDVIILDWHLRKSQSLSMIPEIRSIRLSVDTPIILYTGVELGKEMHDLKEEGIQGFLKKPTLPESVKAELQRLSLI